MAQEFAKLEKIIENTISANIPGIVLAVGHHDRQEFLGSHGNLMPDSQFFIASATKLYVTAILLQLVDKGSLHLNDKISKYLSSDIIKDLHVLKGVDHTQELTIEHLMAHTSGLPDYFQAAHPTTGKSLMQELFADKDLKWNLETVVEDSKKLGAVFVPESGRALYSDTNYQLLGKIIENVLDKSFAEVVHELICQSLHLEKTYVYEDESDRRPTPLNYKDNILNIPKAMTSFGPDGGIVSTAKDGIKFLRAFFEGDLFHESHIQEITAQWRKIFFPMRYGIGISLFRLPWFFSPFIKVPDLMGHSGLSGAFLFYCPKKELYLAGTVNQIDKPQISFQLMIKAIQIMKNL